MRKKDIAIIIVVALLIFTPIIVNEVNKYNLRILKKEVLNLSEILSSSKKLKKVEINKSLRINNKTYATRGKGQAFVYDQGVIVVLSYKNYCAIKVPSINEVVLSKSSCPNYELIKGTIIKVVEKDGLVQNKDNYYYKGKADNHLLFNNELWYILGFEKNKIKIIKEEAIINIEKEKALEYLNNEFYNSLDKSKISDHNFDTSSIFIKNKINIDIYQKNKNHIGILSIFDYVNTLNDECISKNNILICEEGFITKSMWLANDFKNNSYYIYNDQNIYMDSSSIKKDIYPVLYLNENIEIISGYGTKAEPYIVD